LTCAAKQGWLKNDKIRERLLRAREETKFRDAQLRRLRPGWSIVSIYEHRFDRLARENADLQELLTERVSDYRIHPRSFYHGGIVI
jgi:hypothetical protein